MARTSPTHWVGVIFFLIAAILLLITTISAPVIGDIAILKIDLANKTNIRHGSITFGTFGHCALDVPPIDTDQDYCSKKSIGYQAASITTDADGTTFGSATHDSIDGLTNTMVLHPIACGIAFLAFLISIGAGVIGSLIGALVGALAWVLTLVAMAIDFSIFGVIKNHVNNNSGSTGSHAHYSTGMWTILAAMILLFLGMFIVLFTCFSARRAKKAGRVSGARHAKTSADAYPSDGVLYEDTRVRRKKKRFGIF